MIIKKARQAQKLTAFLIALALACAPMCVLSQSREPSTAAQERKIDPQDARNLSLAFGYHELAVLYIEKGDFDKAAAETRKILKLHFSAEYEPLVAQSLGIITEKLGESRRFELAQSLLDEAEKSLEGPSTLAKIHKIKARLYRLSGDIDKAIESMKRALALESR